MNQPSPHFSKLKSSAQTEAYMDWVRDKVMASLGDGQPTIAHDEAMAQVHKLIDEKRDVEARLTR